MSIVPWSTSVLVWPLCTSFYNFSGSIHWLLLLFFSFVLWCISIGYVSWASYQETHCCAVPNEGIFNHKQGIVGLKRIVNDKSWTPVIVYMYFIILCSDIETLRNWLIWPKVEMNRMPQGKWGALGKRHFCWSSPSAHTFPWLRYVF